MFKHFVAAREDEPADAWRARFALGRDDAVRWYLWDGLEPPPSAIECRAALRHHMPELLSHYDKARSMGGAQRYPSISVREVDGFREGLNPS
jgi:predicted choloylglycine hydrolase